MLTWILYIGAAVALLIALVAAVGAMLPRSHVAARSLRVNRPPQEVWNVITNVEAFPNWRSGIARVERLPDANGLPVWRETDRRNNGLTLACEAFEPPRRLVTRIADKNLPFGGAWTWVLAPAGSGCELSITENGEIYNPIFRFMARFVLGYTMTIDAYLKSLAKHLGESGNHV